MEQDGSCSTQHKRRKLSKYTGSTVIPSEMAIGNSSKMSNVQLEEEPELISYDEFFQHYKVQGDAQVKPTTVSPSISPTTDILPTPSMTLTTTTTTTRKRGGKRNSTSTITTTTITTSGANQGVQNECCLIGCHNSVTNRLRFSLRCHKNEDFKQDFLENGWNKVCHYHYFSDLYKYKKMTHGTAKNGNGTATGRKKSPAPEPTPVLGKRGRKTFEEQPVQQPAVPVDQRIEDANVFVHFLMTTKQGGDL
jgi:hypothetical protein